MELGVDIVRIRLLEDFPFPDRDPLELLAPAHPGDAGIDLYASEDAVLLPGERRLVATGLALSLPAGMEGQVRPRSGNALRHGLGMLNAPGTIDPGYRGPVKVLCHNANPPFAAEDLEMLHRAERAGRPPRPPHPATRRAAGIEEPETGDGSDTVGPLLEALGAALERRAIRIRRGERIAQLVFARFERPRIQIAAALEETTRGAGGFGSTGTVSGLRASDP